MVYGIDRSTDEAGAFNGMVPVSWFPTVACSPTSSLPSAWADTEAEPFGKATEVTDTLPANGANVVDSGVQLIWVSPGIPRDPSNLANSAMSSL